MSRQEDHESAFVRSFVVQAKQARLIGLLSNPKRRRTILRTLAHFSDLDPQFKVAIPRSQHRPADIEALLRARGAPDECYVICDQEDLDAKFVPLDDALRSIVGFVDGALVSCVPGRLGFYEGEYPGDRWILERGHS